MAKSKLAADMACGSAASGGGVHNSCKCSKPKSLDAAYERHALQQGWDFKPVFEENQSWLAVIKDMEVRNEIGAEKYNRYLTPNVQDDMLQHAYEEALDLAVYLKTEILKRAVK